MDASTHNYDQVPQITSRTIRPQEQSIPHQQHIPQYRCSHMNGKAQPKSIVDSPYVRLNDQHTRDLTDVYRREKNFLEQRNRNQSYDKIFSQTKENLEPEYAIKELCYNIPCNCQTSSSGKLLQSFTNKIKLSMEFCLFMGYVVGRRNELLEYHYPFDQHQSYSYQANHNYPFVHRSTYNNEMQQINDIREQLKTKRSPIKHTTTNTYYDIH